MALPVLDADSFDEFVSSNEVPVVGFIGPVFGLSASATAIFRERVVVYLETGIPAAENMALLLDRVAKLDMALAHAEIEQERAARAPLATHRVCPTARRGKFPP